MKQIVCASWGCDNPASLESKDDDLPDWRPTCQECAVELQSLPGYEERELTTTSVKERTK